MTAEDVKQVVRKNRPAALWGVVAGVVVLAAWIGYVVAMTPSRPVIDKAPPAEVVAYVCNERGLAKLPQIEQEDFLRKWHAHLTSGHHAKALQEHLVALDDDARKQFVDVIFKHLKRVFLTDARQFVALTDPVEKSRFVRGRFEQMESQSAFIKEVGKAFARDFTGGVTYEEWLIRNTTPEERELGTPYFDALRSVRDHIRKEQRAASSNAAAVPQAPDRTASKP